MKIYFYLIVFFFQPLLLLSQDFELLPKNNLWEVQSLDPLASQVFGHIAKVWEDNEAADYAVASFAFGFQRPVVRWNFKNGNAFEIGMEGSAITQFEFTNREDVFRRSILSTDYLAGVPMIYKTGTYAIRFRIYHLSAHSGDDFLILNNISSYHKNNNNYEQVDITLLYPCKDFSFLAGAGAVIRVYEPRKPIYLTAGFNYSYPLNWRYNTKFYTGIYLDARQDHNFRPAINIGAGGHSGG